MGAKMKYKKELADHTFKAISTFLKTNHKIHLQVS